MCLVSTRNTFVDRAMVARAGLLVVEDSSVEDLTLPRVAAELGVEVPMVLRCVRGHPELLDLVVSLLLEPVRDAADRLDVVSWQGYLYGVGQAMRRAAMERPLVFPLVATRPSSAPWLRTPIRDLQLVERLLKTLHDYGFDDRQCAAAYRAFASVVLGHLLIEAADLSPSTLEAPWANTATEDPSSRTTLQRLRAVCERDSDDAEFDAALGSLLDRIEDDVHRRKRLQRS